MVVQLASFEDSGQELIYLKLSTQMKDVNMKKTFYFFLPSVTSSPVPSIYAKNEKFL